MPEAFSERVDKASSIKGVLDQYPYGNGLLREQVQNSDDAGATTQVGHRLADAPAKIDSQS